MNGVKGRTILVGDDAGVASDIDKALIELSGIGCLDRCDSVVNYPNSSKLLKNLTNLVGSIGLHINLSSGLPILPPSQLPSMIHNGSFVNPAKWVQSDCDTSTALARLRDFAISWDANEVALEVEAQLERFILQVGRLPDGVSVHHDLDYVPNIRHIINDVVGLPSRIEQLKSRELATYEYDFVGIGVSPETWCTQLTAAISENNKRAGTHLIACHPAFSSSGYRSFSAYREGRVVEYKALKLLAGGMLKQL